MPSENNHIDNFLRNKASEAAMDASRMDADWQQMKEMLVKPSSLPSKPGSRTLRFRRYLPYAAGVIMVVTTVTIMLSPGKKSKPRQLAAVTKKTVAPAVDRTVKPSTTASFKNTTASSTVANKLAPTRKQTTKQEIRTEKKSPLTMGRKSSGTITTDSLTEIVATAKPDPKTIFNNFYNELKKPAQEFVINAKGDTTILCEEGSSLFVPAGAFQTVAGLAITGTVRISIQEFYSFADIISNKLSTTSNSIPLETGGMLSINASSGGEPVVIKPGASLDLKMPTRSFNPQMQLFTGQQRLTLMDTVKAVLPGAFNTQILGETARVHFDTIAKSSPANGFSLSSLAGSIDWAPVGQQQYFIAENRKIITLFNVRDNPYHIASNWAGKSIAKFAIPYSASISTTEMKEILETKYGRYYDKIKVKRAWRSWVDKNRTYKNTGTTKKGRDRVIGDWYKTTFVGDSIRIPLQLACRLKMISPEDSLAWEEKFKQQLETAMKQKRAYQEMLQKRNEYSFKITNLGWINCDRFLEYPSSRLTAYAFKAGAGFDHKNFQAILVFDKEKSVMQGYLQNDEVRFGNIPVGHTVHLICTGVRNGKMQVSMQTFVIEKFQKPQLLFEETDKEQFRQKLAHLGNTKSI